MAETDKSSGQQVADLEATAPAPESIAFSVTASPILVIGIAGRIGGGASFVRDKILQSLRTFNYDVDIVDVTAIMENMSSQLGNEELERIDSEVASIPYIEENELAKRVRRLQLLGNSFRRNYGNSILAVFATELLIAGDLSEPHGEPLEPHGEPLEPHGEPLEFGKKLTSRKAYIVDSLKHPEEAALLRTIFGPLFWLVGVVSSDMTRLQRLKQRKEFSEKIFDYLSEQDADGEDELDTNNKKSGQRTIEVVLEADYFFANDFATKDEIEAEVARLTRLIFGIQVVSPTQDEIGMNAAFQASLRSACLSRQVGAANLGRSGELLSAGCNDVPRFGGGLYGPAPAYQDRRCWAWGAKCYNDEEKKKIILQVVEMLCAGEFIQREQIAEAVTALRKSRIKGLSEFTRAVHAEMEAILSIARLGTNGLIGSTLFSTLYPCHYCAKHIIDAGIARVVYLEPYEKSLARMLHPDAINNPQQERSDQKVCFDNYGGVAPRRFSEFFQAEEKRKKDGRFTDSDRIRHRLLPVYQEEASTLGTRLKNLAKWLDERLSQGENGGGLEEASGSDKDDGVDKDGDIGGCRDPEKADCPVRAAHCSEQVDAAPGQAESGPGQADVGAE